MDSGAIDVYKLNVAEGETCYRNGNYSQAAEAYSNAIEENPECGDLYLARCRCYIALGESAKAIEDADLAVKYVGVGIFSHQAGNNGNNNEEESGNNDKKSRPARITASGINCEAHKAFYLKGEALFLTGEFELALIEYYRALEARNDIKEYQRGIARSQQSSRRAFSIDNTVVGEILNFLNAGIILETRGLFQTESGSSMSGVTAKDVCNSTDCDPIFEIYQPIIDHYKRECNILKCLQNASANAFESLEANADAFLGNAAPASNDLGGGTPVFENSTAEFQQANGPSANSSSAFAFTNSKNKMRGSSTKRGASTGNRSKSNGVYSCKKSATLDFLAEDKMFLRELAEDGMINKEVSSIANNGVNYLSKREKFWQQQQIPLNVNSQAKASTGMQIVGNVTGKPTTNPYFKKLASSASEETLSEGYSESNDNVSNTTGINNTDDGMNIYTATQMQLDNIYTKQEQERQIAMVTTGLYSGSMIHNNIYPTPNLSSVDVVENKVTSELLQNNSEKIMKTMPPSAKIGVNAVNSSRYTRKRVVVNGKCISTDSVIETKPDNCAPQQSSLGSGTAVAEKIMLAQQGKYSFTEANKSSAEELNRSNYGKHYQNNVTYSKGQAEAIKERQQILTSLDGAYVNPPPETNAVGSIKIPVKSVSLSASVKSLDKFVNDCLINTAKAMRAGSAELAVQFCCDLEERLSNTDPAVQVYPNKSAVLSEAMSVKGCLIQALAVQELNKNDSAPSSSRQSEYTIEAALTSHEKALGYAECTQDRKTMIRALREFGKCLQVAGDSYPGSYSCFKKILAIIDAHIANINKNTETKTSEELFNEISGFTYLRADVLLQIARCNLDAKKCKDAAMYGVQAYKTFLTAAMIKCISSTTIDQFISGIMEEEVYSSQKQLYLEYIEKTTGALTASIVESDRDDIDSAILDVATKTKVFKVITVLEMFLPAETPEIIQNLSLFAEPTPRELYCDCLCLLGKTLQLIDNLDTLKDNRGSNYDEAEEKHRQRYRSLRTENAKDFLSKCVTIADCWGDTVAYGTAVATLKTLGVNLNGD